MKVIIQESLSKKAKNNRSTFLSALMTNLGGDPGNAVADAFVSKDADKFKAAWGEITNKLLSTLKK